MDELNEAQEDILEELSDVGSNLDVFMHLTELAEMLPDYPKERNDAEGVSHFEELNIEGNPDIALKIWMNGDELEFTARTERKPLQGILYYVYDLFAGLSPEEVAAADVFFIDELGAIGISQERIETVKQAVAAVQEYAADHS